MSLRANLMLLLTCTVLPAQVAEKPFTNSDVANLVRAGLPESTVVISIQRAVALGYANFDASPEAMIELKNAGASEPILNTILTAPDVHPYEPSTSVAGLPVSRGLYVQSGSGWSELDSVLLWPDIETQYRLTWRNLWSWDVTSENRRYLLKGRQARAHVTGPRPTFYLRSEHPGGGWMLLRLSPQTNYRELIARVPDVFADQPRMKFDFGAPMELEPSRVAGDVLTLRPGVDLPSGEYLVGKFTPGPSWIIEGYTFEVGTT